MFLLIQKKKTDFIHANVITFLGKVVLFTWHTAMKFKHYRLHLQNANPPAFLTSYIIKIQGESL
jgi:hypothetical protein